MDSIVALEWEVSRLLPQHLWTSRQSEQYRIASGRWTDAVWSTAKEAGPISMDSAAAETGRRLAGRVVFICGVHRSGTTLVRDLLDGHPELSVLPSEGSHFTTHYPRMRRLSHEDAHRLLARVWVDRLANPANQPPFWTLGRTTSERSPYVDFVRELSAWDQLLAATSGCEPAVAPHLALMLAYATCANGGILPAGLKWLVEKTPLNELHLGKLRAALPGMRVIHVVRHPYAVFASRKRIEERSLGEFRSARSVLIAMRRSLGIAAAAARAASTSAANDHLVVRYEDILGSVEAFVRRVAEFLEIEPHGALLQPTVAGRPAAANSSFLSSPPPGMVLSPEGFRSEAGVVLTRDERRTISALMSRDAAALGYALEPVRPFEMWVRLAKRYLPNA